MYQIGLFSRSSDFDVCPLISLVRSQKNGHRFDSDQRQMAQEQTGFALEAVSQG